ncbi:MAG: alpha/beta hydrolase [Thermoguttaceae bacterium]|nr:alpha/beta hydrolase [Thermoguttaceae bacterium]
MKKHLLTAAAFVFAAATFASSALAEEKFPLWPDVAPGAASSDVKPTYEYWKPENKTSDSCVIVFPGGAYEYLTLGRDAKQLTRFFNERGVTVVVLNYRVPRPKNAPKHLLAWQDAQRVIRVVRSRAAEWGLDPEKIGALGLSAGGHLTLMAATSSQTASYEAVDEIDKLPSHLNFAIPVYPAYVLEDGANGPNANRGIDSPTVADFAFDDMTPPMILLHGDADAYSPNGSIAVYAKLRKMGIPAELHIYANVPHGFVGNPPSGKPVDDWLNRVDAWMKKLGF